MKQKFSNLGKEAKTYARVYFITFEVIAMAFLVYTIVSAVSGKQLRLLSNSETVLITPVSATK